MIEKKFIQPYLLFIFLKDAISKEYTKLNKLIEMVKDDQKKYLVVIVLVYKLMKILDKMDYDILYDLIYEFSVFPTYVNSANAHIQAACSIEIIANAEAHYQDAASQFFDIDLQFWQADLLLLFPDNKRSKETMILDDESLINRIENICEYLSELIEPTINSEQLFKNNKCDICNLFVYLSRPKLCSMYTEIHTPFETRSLLNPYAGTTNIMNKPLSTHLTSFVEILSQLGIDTTKFNKLIKNSESIGWGDSADKPCNQSSQNTLVAMQRIVEVNKALTDDEKQYCIKSATSKDWKIDKCIGELTKLDKKKVSLEFQEGQYDGEVIINTVRGADQSILDGLGVFSYKDGSVYKGQWKDGKREGKGKMTDDNGTIYEGEWKNDRYHGKGRLTDNRNETIYEGEWQNDRYHGKGKMTDNKKGTIYEGEWKNDNKEGKGKMTDNKNGTIYEGEWKNGNKEGKGKWINDNTTYIGTFFTARRGEIHLVDDSQAKIIYPNGDIYEGSVHDMIKRGKGKMTYYATGQVVEGTWKNDKLVT